MKTILQDDHFDSVEVHMTKIKKSFRGHIIALSIEISLPLTRGDMSESKQFEVGALYFFSKPYVLMYAIYEIGIYIY